MTHRKLEFIKKLETILDKQYVLSSLSELVAYESDGLTGYRIKPFCVTLPGTSQEISEILKLCYQFEIPFVPRDQNLFL